MTKSVILDREGLVNAIALPIEDVPIGDDGKVVRLRGMTALEVTEFQKETMAVGPDLASLDDKSKLDEKALVNGADISDQLELNAILIVRSAIDNKGERLFTDAETSIVVKWPMVTLIKLRDVAMRLSGLTQLGDEEAGLNPSETPGGDSSSGLPSLSGKP